MIFLVGCQPKDKKSEEAEKEQKETSQNDKEEDDLEEEEDNSKDDKAKDENGDAFQAEAEALALDFSLSDGKGNMINVADYNDKFVFLNFFTTWCGYCMEEMPEFQTVYNQYKDDVEIIIVNVNFEDDQSVEDVVKWYEEEGFTFPMLIDEGVEQTEAFYPYVTGFPTTFVYAKGGEYLGYLSGGLNEASMKEIIEGYMDK
jgi:cytochrome c-type biogenesis protein